MGMGVKCPKCGFMQLSGLTCKSCGASLSGAAPRPSPPQDLKGAGGPVSGWAPLGELAADFPEIREIQRAEKYDFASIFPRREGYGARRAMRAKIGLLIRLSPLVARIVGEQERVLFVARGIIQYLAEIVLGNGWLTYYYNIHALVFTDRRIILINITRAGQPKHMIHQIGYDQIQAWKGPSILTGAVVIKLEDGRKLTLVRVPRRDARSARELIGRLRAPAALGPLPAVAQSFQNLCPSCFVEVPKDIYECARCRTAFKTPKKAALRSFLLPGLGDIYLTHRFLGSLELLGSALLVILLLMALVWGEPEEAMVFLVVILFYHALDAALTYHMGKKGLIPEG